MRRIGRHVVIWMTYKGAIRIGIGILVIAMTGILLNQSMPVTRTWSYWTLPLSGQTIAIDAGHGGVDGGAASKQGVIEKDLNLSIALYLRDYLQQAGAMVVMTREGDYDLATGDARAYSKRKTEDLKKRVSVIKESKPAAVISIHMNSIPSTKWSGAQTFYHPANHPDNRTLASFIQDEIKRNLENTTRTAAVVKDVYVLKALENIPAALVEVGFLSNPGEAERLADTDYQRQVAASIYEGILRYSSGEKLSGSMMEDETITE
ncbi:N-acetylmuramoyl-L-alanine amidase CwlD [Paenibacillus alkaliterrae]|uniref:N-acetylmuramoyl-L-alanine amidase CwlD n=1 Tax=Paenibacillus alkaliterrae TaxID=320909 RepID=UPI001F18BAB1|nr:N-acetylmuramoyl-L-alanine amidase CwlD [Paenibacillus alkaliterrae]MCF2940275.1 N-acetylmuramoyl-L-alanine amidase CwlD [Paenibacillus alkaliterrae]